MNKQQLIARTIGDITRPERAAGLFGPANKENRRAIMEATTGEKLPLDKCGITAMMSALYKEFETQGGCEAEREANLGAALRAALESIPTPTRQSTFGWENLPNALDRLIPEKGER